jgi:hypothetical protein
METASSDGRAANALHFDDDWLARIVDAWPSLAASAKARILAALEKNGS